MEKELSNNIDRELLSTLSFVPDERDELEERDELMQRTISLAWNLARWNYYRFPSRSLMEQWDDQLRDNYVLASPLEFFDNTPVNNFNEIEVSLDINFSTTCNYWCSGHRNFPDHEFYQLLDTDENADADYVLKLITSHSKGFPSDTYETYHIRLDNVFTSEDDNNADDQIMLRIRKQLLQDIDQIYYHQSARTVLSDCKVVEKVMKSISDRICEMKAYVFQRKAQLIRIHVLVDSREHKFFETIDDVDSVIVSAGNFDNPQFTKFFQNWRSSMERSYACLFFDQQRNRRNATKIIW